VPAGVEGAVNLVRTEARACLLAEVARQVAALPDDHPRLVAIDGVDGAGKTTLGDELSQALAGCGHAVVRASIDSFHNPRAVRYRRGKGSPEGYYRDSFNLDSVRTMLLDPMRSGPGATFRRAGFDEPSDRLVEAPAELVEARMLLIFDGVFAHRPELLTYWDFTVLLQAEKRTDAAWLGYLHSDLPEAAHERGAELERRWTISRRRRYVDGQALYFAEATPMVSADVVIDNNDLGNPVIL